MNLQTLVDWHQRHCDGSWEHRCGIRLETLDNPGWLLTVDLAGTELESEGMTEVREGLGPSGHPVAPCWIHCFVKDQKFLGACDPSQVDRLFEVFERFARRPAV